MKELFFLGFPLEALKRLSHPRRVAATQQCSKRIRVRKEPNNIKHTKNKLNETDWNLQKWKGKKEKEKEKVIKSQEGLENVYKNSLYPDVCMERTNVDWPILVNHKIDPWMKSIKKGTQQETWTKKWKRDDWPSISETCFALLSQTAVRFRDIRPTKTGISMARKPGKKARGTWSNESLHIFSPLEVKHYKFISLILVSVVEDTVSNSAH